MLVDPAGGVSLPALHHLLQRPVRPRGKQAMRVIWHYNPGNLVVSISIEKRERIGENCSAILLAEQARSVSGIQPGFRSTGKALVILGFEFGRPRFWMKTEPTIPIVRQLFQQVGRKGVAKMKSDKIDDRILLPVGQTVFCLTDIGPRIEEVQIVPIHKKILSQRRRGWQGWAIFNRHGFRSAVSNRQSLGQGGALCNRPG